MGSEAKAVFLVDGHSEPAVLKIAGRANHTNCSPVVSFFRRVAEDGRRRLVVDFSECTAMDSTFLGVLAGAAMEFKRHNFKCKLILTNLDEHNFELIRNLGLCQILEVAQFVEGYNTSNLKMLQSRSADASTVLKAHENLVQANSDNLRKFEDVITYLKKEAKPRMD